MDDLRQLIEALIEAGEAKSCASNSCDCTQPWRTAVAAFLAAQKEQEGWVPECEIIRDRTWVGQYRCAAHDVWFRDGAKDPSLCPVGVALMSPGSGDAVSSIRAEKSDEWRPAVETPDTERPVVVDIGGVSAIGRLIWSQWNVLTPGRHGPLWQRSDAVTRWREIPEPPCRGGSS